MVVFVDSCESISATQLTGFFVGWPDPPSPETHLRLLQGSDYIVLAIDDATTQVVGFITAISDGVLSAYIPLLEVLPQYQGKGIGAKLVKRMLQSLNGFYIIDLLCDPELQAFYEHLGMRKASGMQIRNYSRQSGRKP